MAADVFTKHFVDPMAWCHALTLLSIFGSVKYVGKHSAARSPTAAVVAGAGGALALPAVPPFPIGPASAEEQAMGGRPRTRNDVRREKKVKFALEDRRSVAAAVIAVSRQDYLPDICCGGSKPETRHKQEPNSQHKCCGNISCSNCVGPLAPLLSHVSLRNIFAPATLQQPCARLCVSRQAKAMPPKPSPPERSPAAWPMANAKHRPLVPINRWSTIPKAQSIDSYEHHDTSLICAHLGINLMVQPKSPSKAHRSRLRITCLLLKRHYQIAVRPQTVQVLRTQKKFGVGIQRKQNVA